MESVKGNKSAAVEVPCEGEQVTSHLALLHLPLHLLFLLLQDLQFVGSRRCPWASTSASTVTGALGSLVQPLEWERRVTPTASVPGTWGGIGVQKGYGDHEEDSKSRYCPAVLSLGQYLSFPSPRRWCCTKGCDLVKLGGIQQG